MPAQIDGHVVISIDGVNRQFFSSMLSKVIGIIIGKVPR